MQRIGSNADARSAQCVWDSLCPTQLHAVQETRRTPRRCGQWNLLLRAIFRQAHSTGCAIVASQIDCGSPSAGCAHPSANAAIKKTHNAGVWGAMEQILKDSRICSVPLLPRLHLVSSL